MSGLSYDTIIMLTAIGEQGAILTSRKLLNEVHCLRAISFSCTECARCGFYHLPKMLGDNVLGATTTG